MLVDLLFEDNPWWFGKGEVTGRKLEINTDKKILKIWAPPGCINKEDIMATCYRWAEEYGEFSALLIDLSKHEVLPDMALDMLEFYFSRMYSTSNLRIIFINHSHWVNYEEIIKEFSDETTIFVFIYPLLTVNVDRKILVPYKGRFDYVGDAFWEGDVRGMINIVSSRSEMRRAVERFFWRHVVGFPKDLKDTGDLKESVVCINEYYEIREKILFRKFLNFVVENHAREFVYRDVSEKLEIRFETIKSFADYMFSAGLLFEISEIGSSPRSHRRFFISRGKFYNSLRHVDNKSLLQTPRDDIILKYSIPYVVLRALEEGFEVFFKDESATSLILKKGEKIIGVDLKDVPYYIIAGI